MSVFERIVLKYFGLAIELMGILGCIMVMFVENLFPFINISRGIGAGQVITFIIFGSVAILGVWLNKFFNSEIIPLIDKYLSSIICPYVDNINQCPYSEHDIIKDKK